MCPTYTSTLFEQPAIKYELRNHDFTMPRFNTVSFGKHSLRYMGPRAWSSVPSNVKKASTLSSFKYNIRKVDLSMLLDDNNCSNCSFCTSQSFLLIFSSLLFSLNLFFHVHFSRLCFFSRAGPLCPLGTQQESHSIYVVVFSFALCALCGG